MLAGTTLAGAAATSLTGCAARPKMCGGPSDCSGDKGVCVAGRCQLDKPTVKPAIDTARRWVLRPADLAFVQRGGATGAGEGGLPPVVALGTESSRLFLRFDAAIPPTATIVEAYVVLRRSAVVDDDPTPISLHATRIVDAWSGGSVSWAFQPRLGGDQRSPSTTVEPGGSPVVRIDVREIVRHWARRDPRDQGIAIIAENESRTGTTFALTPERNAERTGDHGSGQVASALGPPRSLVAAVEPYLELYVR